jgi:uncharacterized protein (TIGR03435 family)
VKSTSVSRVLVVLLILGSAAGALGQQSKPSFEVASVRPTLSKRLSEINVEIQPRRFVATMVPLRWLIAVAYGPVGGEPKNLNSFPIKRIVGGPSWIDSASFDIQAVTEEDVPPATMRLMLQRLLEERFGLRLRTEQRNMEAYALLLDRRDGRLGPQLRPAQVKDCSKLTDQQQVDRRCGDGASGDTQTMTIAIYGSDKDMAAFGEHLGGPTGANLDRPVIDRTGLKGRFDYEVRFSPTAGRLDSVGPALPPVPDLFRALRDQLGLKLEPVIAPVDILVVDSAEQPTAN